MKKLVLLALTLVLALGLAACGKESSSGSASKEKKEIKIGATSGPYADMVKKAIAPQLEKDGYKVEIVEFSDYVQPNISLGNGSIDANLFQHKIYMENFAKENNLELSELISVPTAPMGIYSNKLKDLKEIKKGTTLALPNDPTNMARALKILDAEGIIKLDPAANPLTVSEKDVKENPHGIQFKPLEAAQLPRAVESVDLSAVPGNFALAAKMDLLDALKLEEMEDEYRNRVVINTKDLDKDFAKAIKKAVESDEFEKTIDSEFKGFGKPEWMK
ncbi:MetQ/NlpA family ABC transporter substrate-binding protein [Peribacillus sp. SCS-155]|uniref:MetQ/NlpA family ABC transporter substrate-binding protein n=1 Tax=Peribacillus sedimenti TaxID=3115297 RepID=UPI003905DBA4